MNLILVTNQIQKCPLRDYSGFYSYFKKIAIELYLKKWKKKSVTRYNQLKQLRDAQANHLNNLAIIQDISNYCIKKKIINQTQYQILTPHIQQRKILCKQIIAQLITLIQNWCPKNTKLSNMVKQLRDGFKLYKDHYNNIMEINKICQKLYGKTTQQIKNNIPNFNKNSQIVDYISHISNLSFYFQNTIKNYLHQLPKDHIDYLLLKKNVNAFENILTDINQSMRKSINEKKMIQIQLCFGEVVGQTPSQLIQQIICNSIYGKLRLFIFDRFILITKTKSSQLTGKPKYSRILSKKQLKAQYQFKRIFYDSYTFINKISNFKSYQNGLIIISSCECFFFYFEYENDRDQCFSVINTQIKKIRQKFQRPSIKIHQSQKLRNQTAKSLPFPLKQEIINSDFSQPSRAEIHKSMQVNQQNPVQQHFSVNFTPIGMKIISYDIFFYFQVSYNGKFKFSEIVEISSQKFQQFQKKAQLNNLKQITSQCFKQVNHLLTQQSVKMTQQTHIMYQAKFLSLSIFINNLFRKQIIFDQFKKQIIKAIQISQQFWNQISSMQKKCTCSRCQENKFSWQQYFHVEQLIQNKERVCNQYFFSIWCQMRKSKYPLQFQYNHKNILKLLRFKDSCPSRIFHNKPRNYKIRILILNENPSEEIPNYIDVQISSETFVAQIMEQVRKKLKIKHIFDYNLYSRVIDSNTKLEINTLLYYSDKIASLYLQKSSFETPQYFDRQRMKSNLGGLPIINDAKIMFYLKKTFNLSYQLEIKQCYGDLQRIKLIVGQIFCRYKNYMLVLNNTDSKKLIAIYYIMKNLITTEGTEHIKKLDKKLNNFNQVSGITLKQTVKDNRSFIIDDYLKKQLFDIIVRYKDLNLPKLHFVIFKMIITKQQWYTEYFDVENLQPKTLTGDQQFLQVGVNRKAFIVKRYNKLDILLDIQLKKLNYIRKGLKLQIKIQTQTQNQVKTYQFYGFNIMGIEYMIQSYKELSKIIGNHQ